MRLLDTLPDQPTATRFADYLLTQGVRTSVEEGSGGGWLLWVEHDDHLDRARQELTTFRANPDDARYDRAGDARKLRKAADTAERRRREKFVDVRTSWGGVRGAGRGAVTYALIAICLGVGVLTRLGADQYGPVMNWLRFEQLSFPSPNEIEWQHWGNVTTGQVWRLVTPIFVHYGVLHLVFNMLWLHQLGGAIEGRRGTLVLLALVLAAAIVGNCAEYLLDLSLTRPFAYDPSPNFGGMSGVVYALFGYVWVTGRTRPYLGLGLNEQTVTIMLVWLVLCMTGLVGPVANVAHLAGLLVGVAAGYAPVAWRKFRRK